MSIIHEALKKAQANLDLVERNKSSQPPLTEKTTNIPIQNISTTEVDIKLKNNPDFLSTLSNESINEKNTKNNTLIPLAVIVILCIICINTILFFALKPSKEKIKKEPASIYNAPTTSSSTNITPVPISTLPPEIPKEMPKFSELILKGTVTMGDRRVAIINDEVYEVGEFVAGNKILNISMKEVTLEKDGTSFTLLIKKK